MTTDEPGGWELKRALSELRDDVREGQKAIREDVAKMVTQAAHQADLRRIEDQIKGLTEDVAAERQSRVEGIALEREQRTIELNRVATAQEKALKDVRDDIKSAATWVRWVAASVMVPVVLFVANMINARGS